MRWDVVSHGSGRQSNDDGGGRVGGNHAEVALLLCQMCYLSTEDCSLYFLVREHSVVIECNVNDVLSEPILAAATKLAALAESLNEAIVATSGGPGWRTVEPAYGICAVTEGRERTGNGRALGSGRAGFGP